MLDDLVERLSRRTATRTTRRSFLGKAGRAAVIVAGGPGLAVLLSQGDDAAARVCGQSGISPQCPTYDCSETWGWCWYANGCCADGLLKKICDCCAPNTPNPVGYCPAGLRVLCIVESCGADPRLQTRPLIEVLPSNSIGTAVAISARRYAGGNHTAVLGDADDARFTAVAASVGRIADGPVLLTHRKNLHQSTAVELDRLRVEFVKVVGSWLDPSIDAALAERGIAVERIGVAQDAAEFAAEVAVWGRALTGARTAVVVLEPGEVALAEAAAVAHARRLPLLLGEGSATLRALATPRPVRRTIVVGASASRTDASDLPGAVAVPVGDRVDTSVAVADAAIRFAGLTPGSIALAPAGEDPVALQLALIPGVVLRHPRETLDGLEPWLLAHRDTITEAWQAGSAAAFPPKARYDLQSILNEFEAHLLRGSVGEGLPVIVQPLDERPVGAARDDRPGQ